MRSSSKSSTEASEIDRASPSGSHELTHERPWISPAWIAAMTRGDPGHALDDQTAQVRVADRIVLVGTEVAVAEHEVEDPAGAKGTGPGDRPGGAVVLDRRQRLHSGLHLNVIVELVFEREV